jgi:hypothetical protein
MYRREQKGGLLTQILRIDHKRKRILTRRLMRKDINTRETRVAVLSLASPSEEVASVYDDAFALSSGKRSTRYKTSAPTIVPPASITVSRMLVS